ncbi:hypothetical protein DFH08DRAFT_84448 [Mycena albidolilacea]|uniref:C2H2-type domain-containing protein n=1 Tax=Mycena albidolilacea TaxID=1033008 RepID=A0AAD7A8T3_9AGAR|nr:hypothetical protein DFH08DRAFT_84448 [Mycena albidolilacea]
MATAPEVELEPDLEIIDLTGETSASEGEDYGGGGGSDEEDSSSDPSRAQLRAAIFRVPEARLREVLADLVDTVPAVYHALARELVTVSRTTRVVVPRWETCSNCGETYDVNSDDEECTFHPGEMEVDEEKFDDWDEGCHGPIDTEHTRKEFPENFSWTCCDGDGTTEGCVTGHHSPAVHKKQRV